MSFSLVSAIEQAQDAKKCEEQHPYHVGFDGSEGDYGTSAHAGVFCKGSTPTVGYEEEAHLGQDDEQLGGLDLQIQGPSTNMGETASRDGVDANAGGQLGGVMLKGGTTDPTSDDDSQFHEGISLGVGFDAGLDDSDDDHDGNREYGAHATVGPFDLGYKTESPGKDLLEAAVNPVGFLNYKVLQATGLMDSITGEDTHVVSPEVKAALGHYAD
jgi:hypothetical protein